MLLAASYGSYDKSNGNDRMESMLRPESSRETCVAMSSDWAPPGRRSPQPYEGGTDLHGWDLVSHWLCSYS